MLESRLGSIFGSAIGIAYLLDPQYLGDGMLLDENKQNIPDQQEATFVEYTHLMINAGNEKEAGFKSILQYWLVDGMEYPLLRTVAMKVLGLVTSSAASERNFSTTGFIHSKLRNSRGAERVKKLIYIDANAAQLGGGSISEYQQEEFDSEFDNDGDGQKSAGVLFVDDA